MKLFGIGNKGQSNNAVMSLLVVAMLIFVGALILQNLDTAFSTNFGAGTTYANVYGNLSANNVTGMNLMTILPILLAAGALITAVYAFARR